MTAEVLVLDDGSLDSVPTLSGCKRFYWKPGESLEALARKAADEIVAGRGSYRTVAINYNLTDGTRPRAEGAGGDLLELLWKALSASDALFSNGDGEVTQDILVPKVALLGFDSRALEGNARPRIFFKDQQVGGFNDFHVFREILTQRVSIAGCAKYKRFLELAELLLRRDIEKINADFRHNQKSRNLLAAVRILLGAGQGGILDREELQAVLQELKLKSDGYDFQLVQRYTAISRRVNPEIGRPLPRSVRLGRILLIDDHAYDHGWAAVLKAICTKAFSCENFEVATSFEEVSENGFSRLEAADLVIQDLDLGPEKINGLNAIKTIKRKDWTLPVIAFTAYDDPFVAMDSLKLGASGVFVKELTDSSNRDSHQYMNKFLSTVREAVDPEFRSALKTFSDLLGAHCPSTTLREQLKTAFTFALIGYLEGANRRPNEQLAERFALMNLGWAIESEIQGVFSGSSPNLPEKERKRLLNSIKESAARARHNEPRRRWRRQCIGCLEKMTRLLNPG